MTVKLGTALLQARQRQGATLQVVSAAAKMSPAYLQKLEAGKVGSPNPRLLDRLAGVLGLHYPQLMELAGYLPTAAGPSGGESAAPRSAGQAQVAADAARRPDQADSPRRDGGTLHPTNETLLNLLRQVHQEIAALRQAQERIAADISHLTKT